MTVPSTYHDPIEAIEGRWTMRVLLCLSAGGQRFTELKHALPGISSKTLIDRLRSLDRAGLVEQRGSHLPSAGQTYGLTRSAEALLPVLVGLDRWRGEIAATRSDDAAAPGT